MNLNDKRLGAYNKILKGSKSGSEPEPFTPPRVTRSASADATQNSPIMKELREAQARLRQESGRTEASAAKRKMAADEPPVAGSRTATALRSSYPDSGSENRFSASGSGRPATDSSAKASSADLRRAADRLPGLIKIPSASAGNADGKESPYRKVAKFLLLIGVEEAATVMAKLTPDQTERVVLELASIRRVEPDEAAIVLAEFGSLLKKAAEPSGGVETARTILEAAFGKERAEDMLQKVVPDINGKPFDYLENIDPDRLSSLIMDELPAVKALVLSRIKPKLAAAVIKLMSPEEKNETIVRLARLKSINPDVIRRVDGAMREKVKNINISSADSIDGRSALAEILKRMDGAGEKAILDCLAADDPDLGRDMRERLFTLDDIVNADDKFMQGVLRAMTERDLAILVFGKKENFRQKIFTNVSRTRGTIIQDEEKIIAPLSRAESERVNGDFFAVVRRAWEDGKVSIRDRDDKEVWV